VVVQVLAALLAAVPVPALEALLEEVLVPVQEAQSEEVPVQVAQSAVVQELALVLVPVLDLPVAHTAIKLS
jgi:hypothetical protein